MTGQGPQRVDRMALGVYFPRTLSFVLHRLPVTRRALYLYALTLRLHLYDIPHFYATASSVDSL
ncbi:hypothetical protein FA95DRAFT_1559898 [Auriscalpium vulgare]|uniref:Uncharacterized protein n=1 Tax=Auriscalpium vulgare TaxID=40419 RepID=A0ACB8RT46_9AGAM|nr:hypothetical protein FA95DRAFT_1559898 [Auriscalpium vulgare]